MKRFVQLLISSVLILTGCHENDTSYTDQVKNTYLIPYSLIEFSGIEVKDYTEKLNELGIEFLELAEMKDQYVEVIMTDAQKEKFVERNEKFLHSQIDDFLQLDDTYRCTFDDYHELNLYFDEKINKVSELLTLVSVVTYFGTLQIFETSTSEWNVKVNIYNCHTDKLVASGIFPGSGLEYGEEEWNASYE